MAPLVGGFVWLHIRAGVGGSRGPGVDEVLRIICAATHPLTSRRSRAVDARLGFIPDGATLPLLMLTCEVHRE